MIVTVYRYGEEPLSGYWFSFLRTEYAEKTYKLPNTENNRFHKLVGDFVGGEHLYEYQIKLSNPLIFDTRTCNTPFFPVHLYTKYFGENYIGNYGYFDNRRENEHALARLLRLMGYDSVIFRNPNCRYIDVNGKYTRNPDGYIDLWLLRNIHTYWYYARKIISN